MPYAAHQTPQQTAAKAAPNNTIKRADEFSGTFHNISFKKPVYSHICPIFPYLPSLLTRPCLSPSSG
jgi:hypothetical protein